MSDLSDAKYDVSCESESEPNTSTPSSSSSTTCIPSAPSTSESQSALSSNTGMRSVLSDVLTIENGTESKKALSSLFSQLLEDEDEKD